MKQLLFLMVLCLACSCQEVNRTRSANEKKPQNRITLYSKAVNDSFTVFISLPADYVKSKDNYPVVYLLDANFNFDVMDAVAHNNAMFGMMPPVIIAGIGYSDAYKMDKMRDRDLTYPAAKPEDSFAVSGGGEKFFSFITQELIPFMDANYQTDKSKRILAGHSLAGYFTLYALQQFALGKDQSFMGYIAASPSLEYAHDLLLTQFEQINTQPAKEKPFVYLTMGGMEDEELKAEGEQPRGMALFNQFNTILQSKHNTRILLHSDRYSAFGHMDMPFPSFTKGMQWILNR